ncbi:MAG TPA: FCD domain-containing protein [Desulfatiglandales bacterium]|nr:FCD domain-containing protein [Desulfatiglandales bacterium]
MLKTLQKVVIPRQRLSDQIRDELKRMILRGDLKRGVKLPTEEQLAAQLKVSKVSVREALRNLETEGLIEKRRGIYGGSFVAHPGSEKMGEWVVNYFRVGMITPEELVDFRKTLEPALVALAVDRRTDKDLKAIQTLIDQIDQGVRRGKLNTHKAVEFHRLIGEACHNRLISMVMEALVKVFEEILAKVPRTVEDAKYDLDHCKKIYETLVQRKKGKAQGLMVDHFEILAKIIERGKKEHPPERGVARKKTKTRSL